MGERVSLVSQNLVMLLSGELYSLVDQPSTAQDVNANQIQS